MRMSIIGLAYAGKTTFFDLLTAHGVAGSLSGKKGGQIATAFVPDPRLDHLAAVYQPKKTTRASMEFIDTPSLSAEGEGKSFAPAALEEVRKADTLCLVVQAFDAYPHPMGSVDPRRDIEFVLTEFLLSDLVSLERRAEKLRKVTKITKKPEEIRELEVIEKALAALEAETPLSKVGFDDNERRVLSGYQLLSMKSLLVILNVSEDAVADMAAQLGPLRELFPDLTFSAMCASLESDLSGMSSEDAAEFMQDLGITEVAYDRIIRACFEMLGLHVFLTAGPDECRTWPIPIGATAWEAAGEIHSDIQRGFIRAVVLPYAAFAAAPSPDTFKTQSTQERKEYIMQDGDIVEFRFNVSK